MSEFGKTNELSERRLSCRWQVNRQFIFYSLLIHQCAFGITHGDSNYEIELKLKILSTLRGVEIPVASAILSLCYPDKYGVIDFRNWRLLFGVEKNDFSIKDYENYLNKIRQLANRYAGTPQQIDMVIWQLDKDKGQMKFAR